MLLIDCPYCGVRDESEFNCVGEAHIVRPIEPDALNDYEWADYLFHRSNTKGWHREQWLHSAGCRRYFNAIRHTVTYKFHTTYKIGEMPDLPDENSVGG